MFEWRSRDEWLRLWRYYQVGVLNTLFGYGTFAALVALGMNMYAAQIVSHIAGMAFNYISYSRYAFGDRQASKGRFILSYIANYFIGLFFIWAAARLIPSPYIDGVISIVFTSLVNYFMLKFLVFRTKRSIGGVT